MDTPRTGRLLVGLTACLLVLSACSGDDGGDQQAEDPASTPADTPSGTPTPGGLPEFGPESYEYTLYVSCYCPDAGMPVRVTVVDDEVAEAVYAQRGPGITKGAPATEASHITIDEIIERADNPDAAKVELDWPEGQDYPSEVYVDVDERMVDEELGYRISDVEVR